MHTRALAPRPTNLPQPRSHSRHLTFESCRLNTTETEDLIRGRVDVTLSAHGGNGIIDVGADQDCEAGVSEGGMEGIRADAGSEDQGTRGDLSVYGVLFVAVGGEEVEFEGL